MRKPNCACPPARSRRESIEPYLTASGLPSQSAFRIGKLIGGRLYVHRSAIEFLPGPVQTLIRERHDLLGNPPYDLVNWDPKKDTVAFTETVGWDDLPEPLMGMQRSVNGIGQPGREVDYWPRQVIYHHKHLFVHPSYPGFGPGGYARSEARSRRWQECVEANRPALDAAVGGKSFMSKIGFYPIWREFVIDVIFPDDGSLYDRYLVSRRRRRVRAA